MFVMLLLIFHFPHQPRGLLIALMMEAASISETLVNFYQTTRRKNPEDSHLQIVRSLYCGGPDP
jgi:hypothetical protein